MSSGGKTRKKLSPAQAIFRNAAVGTVVTVALCVLLSLLAAVVISNADLPHRSIRPVAFTIIGISVFSGGFTAGLSLHKRALLIGSITGAISLAVILVASFFLPDALAGEDVALKTLLCLFFSTLGAVIGTNMPRKR